VLDAGGFRVSAVDLASDLAALGISVGRPGDDREGLRFREEPVAGGAEPYAHPGVAVAVAFGVAVLIVCIALVLAG